MHIPSRDQCNWLRERIETKDPIRYSPDRKVHILDRLAWSEMCAACPQFDEQLSSLSHLSK